MYEGELYYDLSADIVLPTQNSKKPKKYARFKNILRIIFSALNKIQFMKGNGEGI